MIERAYLLIDALSVMLCLHQLYGKKFKLDIFTLSFLSVDMIMMTAILYYELPRACSMMIYPIIVVYCGIKFGFEWRKIIINNILYLIIIGAIQLIIAIIYGWIFNWLSLDSLFLKNRELLIVNCGVFFIVLVMLPRFRINRLSVYLQDKERIIVFFLFFCIIITISSLASFKSFNGLNMIQYIILFISICLFCVLVGQLSKYKVKSKEIETELKMNKLYAESFQSLIGDIRMRQHEFENHISTIYSLHYTCDSYEELVRMQEEYSHTIIKENRFNNLLKVGNPLLIGFLYGKFIEIEKLGMEVFYQISIEDLNVSVPVYKLVEILGNLIKNAIEAMKDSEVFNAIYVSVIEIDRMVEIEVRNRSEFIAYSEIESFFKKGFSKKGKERGLGLYNVKSICMQYSLRLMCENKIIDNENWLSFVIDNKKETIT